MSASAGRESADAFAQVARTLQAEDSAQLALDKIVRLAPQVVKGCQHAAVSLVVGRRVETAAETGDLPVRVDRVQYESDEGPCLDAIRADVVFSSDDLSRESRWPRFCARAVAETGVRSMLSLRLFLDEDTLGALNLYSTVAGAFDATSRASGGVFAAHAAVALAAAREHDRAEQLNHDLAQSQHAVQGYEQQAHVALMMQRSMLTPLPPVTGFELAARYSPAAAGAHVGGDWYDAFTRPDGVLAMVVGDVAGHDMQAATQMAQMRSLLRGLVTDRNEPPGELLRRLDRVASHLRATTIATCVFALLETQFETAPARLRYAVAGHPPPLLITEEGSAYLPRGEHHVLLGVRQEQPRSTLVADLPKGCTLLLYTDGLIERRDRDINDGLHELRERATALAAQPLDHFCDAVIAQMGPQHDDDICILALRNPVTN